MRKKRLRDAAQNLALLLLTLSALFLLTRLPLVRNIRLSNQMQALFQPDPSSGGREEDAPPTSMFPSVDLMATGNSEYGRYGRLCAAADDAALQPLLPLFQEALGSAGPLERAAGGDFRGALDGPGLYLAFSGGPLPLKAAAVWLGGETDLDLSLGAMALAAGGDAAVLYLLDGEGGIFRCGTALPASAVRPLCEGFPPNGARFAYETGYGSLAPYAVLTAQSDPPPDLLSELPAGYSAYNLLTALDFNAHTLSRYRESGGAEVVEESPRTLRIGPDGFVSFASLGPDVPALYRASGRGLEETLAAAWRLAAALTAGAGASPLHLATVEEDGSGYTLRFRYQAEGIPVFFSDEGDALSVTFRDGTVTAFSYRCRAYAALEEEPSAMLPAAMAQAIAASYPRSAPSLGYEDDGSGRLAPQWLRQGF